MPLSFKPLEKAEKWVLQNRDVSIDVEKKTGFIRSLLFRKKKVDLFQQLRGGIPGYIGGIRIYDELEKRWYSDMETPLRVSRARKSGNKVSFMKQFKGAPFSVKVTLNLEKDALDWVVEAEKKNRKVADRTLRVFFQMPLIAGWNVWAPCKGGKEFQFDGMTGFEFMYLQVPWVSDYEVILPMTTHFDKGLDVGYSIMEPIDGQVPAAKFQFSNGEKCFNWGAFEKDPVYAPYLEAVNTHIGLTGTRKMKTRVMMMFHEGCWRPGVGKVFKRWKEFFVPPNPSMYKDEGVFTCSTLELDYETARKGHLKTMEVHDHFEHYCTYFNTKPKWMKNHIKETLWRYFGGVKRGKQFRKVKPKNAWEILEWIETHSDREIADVVANIQRARLPKGAKGVDVSKWSDEQVDEYLYRTPARVRESLKRARRHGISPFWYFNYTDGFRPVVEKRWPDAISKHEDGSYLASGWQMCHNMNADPKYSFGKYLIKCAKKIVETYPQLRGFFLDCFRHYEIDFGHDDGITVVNNKPAYSINFSYDDIEGRVKEILHSKDMCTFANKPQTIRTMRWCDGMMLEGNGDQMEEKYFWSAIAKPIIFLWTTNQNSTDENYRRSILHGCYPKLVGKPELTKEQLRELNSYMPLFNQFRRRVFCFDPDPIRVPKGSITKLYTVGKHYVAGIINTNVDEGEKMDYAGTPHAIFRVQRGHDVSKVGVMYPGDKDFRFVKFRFDGTFIFVPMKKYNNCAVVKLFVTKNSGKKVQNVPFPRVIDFCGDPQSSFEDLSTL